MQLLQRRVRVIELVVVGRLKQEHVLLDVPHPRLRQRRCLIPLRGFLRAQPRGDLRTVVLPGQDCGLEIVGHREHWDQRQPRVALVAAEPHGEFRVRPAALEQRIPADQLDLIEQNDPAGVARRPQQPGSEPEPLARQVADCDRSERIEPGRAHRSQGAAEFGDAQGLTAPKPHERVDHLIAARHVASAKSFMAKEGRCKALVQATRGGGHPPAQLGVSGRVRVQGSRGIGQGLMPTSGIHGGLDGRPDRLHRVVQRCLFADDDRAHGKAIRHGEMTQVGEEVALSSAEPSAKQNPGWARRGAPRLTHLPEQRGEPVLRFRLSGAQGGHCIPARHAGAESFHGPAPGHQFLAWR